MKYLIVSDIHSNARALRAVLSSVQEQGGADRALFLGDLLGYGPITDATYVLRWFLNEQNEGMRLAAVPGNHDVWLARPSLGVSSRAQVSLLMQDAFLRRAKVNVPAYTNWARKYRKKRLRIRRKNWQILAVHGSLFGPVDEYVYPWRKKRIADLFLHVRKEIAEDERICMMVGHTHLPMLVAWKNHAIEILPIEYGRPIEIGDKDILLNPGSVGQPRDGDPRAAFAILDTRQRTITFFRQSYDIERTIQDLERDGQLYNPFHPLDDETLQDITRRVYWQDASPDIEKNLQKDYSVLINLLSGRGLHQQMVRYQTVYNVSSDILMPVNTDE